MTPHLIETLGDLRKGLCVLNDAPEGMGFYTHYPAIGRPAVDKVSNPAVFRVSPDHEGLKLQALVGNTVNYLVVSTALKDLLVADNPPETVELLPAAIYDAAKKLLSDDYWIVNPLAIVECLDDDADEHRVLKASALEGAPGLFRIARDVQTYVVSDAIVASVAAKKKLKNFAASALTTTTSAARRGRSR
jgi:hypothetical protein